MEDRYVKIQDKPGFVKDKKTSAILNADDDALVGYKSQRAAILRRNQQIEDTANKTEQLEERLDNIESLLSQILGKLK